MKSVYDIVRKPVITEKSMTGVALNREYTFEVERSANKVEIKKAIEQIFGVEVASVNTINSIGKSKRVGVHRGKTARVKKAIVKLTEASKEIEIFEGMI